MQQLTSEWCMACQIAMRLHAIPCNMLKLRLSHCEAV
jgi:hypothetical protein